MSHCEKSVGFIEFPDGLLCVFFCIMFHRSTILLVQVAISTALMFSIFHSVFFSPVTGDEKF